MTRKEALKLTGAATYVELAKILTEHTPEKPVSKFSIARWGDDPIPKFREYQVKEIANG